MADYQQQNRRFRITTAAGPDALLLTGFEGGEGLSQLYQFALDLLAPLDAPVDFAKVLGQPAVLEIDLPDGQVRHVHGILSRFSQGGRDDAFIHYRAELVPTLWLLTKRHRSRIFQHKTAKEILTQVLEGVPLKWDVREKQATRDYCTQYRESDFAFAARIMEDEGIYYYFTHAADGHTLVLADHPDGHVAVPAQPTLEFEQAGGGQGQRQQFLVSEWEKVQELRTGKVTLWDHHFELPHQPLDAEGTIQNTVQIGTVSHDLRLGNVTALEKYDYPGGYADWFDGVSPGGAPSQAADLQKIFEQNRRMVTLRLQAEAAAAVTISGSSYCGNLTGGHKFALAQHYDADGEYVLTSVSHVGTADGDFRSGAMTFDYSNTFTCLPAALPYRPPHTTPRPTVKGTQTAVVVGPAGEEIFTDPYGRVKVQFHWDREGKHDADSSCWIRVSTIWAGKAWGVIHIPRIGHEVIVDFLEGDPDRPIVLGSVYNADHIPPGSLPKEGMVSGLQSRTTPKGGGSNFNGMRANDTKAKEALDVQAEYNMTTLVKHDDTQTVNNNRTITVLGTHTETITKDTSITVSEGKYGHTVAAGTATIYVKGAVGETFDATQSTTVKSHINTSSTEGDIVVDAVAGAANYTAEKLVGIQSRSDSVKVFAAEEIHLVVGSSSLVMKKDGTITLSGVDVTITGKSVVKMGSGSQSVTCDTSKVAVAGAEINAAATGVHTVAGAVVKIN